MNPLDYYKCSKIVKKKQSFHLIENNTILWECGYTQLVTQSPVKLNVRQPGKTEARKVPAIAGWF